MAFLESPRLPDEIAFWARGGVGYSTDVVVVDSGAEFRQQTWQYAKGRWDLGEALRLPDGADATYNLGKLRDHFRVVKGRTHGWRMKDFTDYKDEGNGKLGLTGIGTGVPAYQMVKNYVVGALTDQRLIRKPVVGTVVAKRNGTPVTVGGAPGNVSIDTTTGVVTFVADATDSVDANSVKSVAANSAKTITGITQANPGNVTAVAHGFANSEKVLITGVVGMTQVNDLWFTVTVVDADHFTIGVDTTAYGAYSSGGTATRYGASKTNPVRMQVTAHGFTNGDKVKAASLGGMTQLNDLYFTVANAATDSFELSGVNGTAYGTYTSGGTFTKYGITQTNPVQVNAAAHGLTNGQLVHVSATVGMTQVNNAAYTVANATANRFELSAVDGTAWGAYASSAILGLYPQPADVLTWTGEFDVPCRFDTDQMEAGMGQGGLYVWDSIPVVEIRT